MRSLSGEDLFVAQIMRRENIALAAGYHHSTDAIMIVTEKATVFETTAESFFGRKFDILSIRPINMGTRIEVQTSESFVEVDTIDVLTSSKSFDLSNLEVNISHENRNS